MRRASPPLICGRSVLRAVPRIVVIGIGVGIGCVAAAVIFVHRIADRLCLKNILVQNRENTILNQFGSDWVLISPTPEVLETPIFRAAGADHPDLAATAPLWTDDYSNLFKIMK